MRFLYNISIVVGCISFLGLIGFIWTYLKSKYNKTEYSFTEHSKHSFYASFEIKLYHLIIPIGLLIIIFTCGSVTRHVFDIHNLETESEGVYCYYVTVSNKDNEYTLPAQISIIHNSADDPDGHPYYWTEYHIEKVYFTNGGYLTFEYDNEVEINTTTSLIDANERDWNCTLLNKHGYSPYIKEVNNLSALTFIEFIGGILGSLYMLLTLIFVYMNNRNERFFIKRSNTL